MTRGHVLPAIPLPDEQVANRLVGQRAERFEAKRPAAVQQLVVEAHGVFRVGRFVRTVHIDLWATR